MSTGYYQTDLIAFVRALAAIVSIASMNQAEHGVKSRTFARLESLLLSLHNRF